MASIDVSIIIVNWNTRDILRDCLDSIDRQTRQPRYEIIVIDNGSTDGSVAMIKSDYPRVCLIENRANVGFAAANNQGLRLAQGRYLLLLNSDTVVLDNAVDKMVAFADENPAAGLFGCRVLNADRSLQSTCYRYPSLLNLLLSSTYLYKLFPRSDFFNRECIAHWQRDDIRQVQAVTGCFMLARRQVIEEVGLMDEQYFMYCEETDWCYRIRRAGWNILFYPHARIIHLGGASSRQVKTAMLVQLRLSILAFMKKHHSRLSYGLACLLTIIFFLIRIPGWFLILVFSVRRRKEALVRLAAYFTGIGRVLFSRTSRRREVPL